ncbi:MAG: hypothetical protein ABIO44_05375, partial [Saprospiraceae bacterium]
TLNGEIIPLEQIIENLSGKFNPVSKFKINVKNKLRDESYFVIHFWNDPDSSIFAIPLKAALDAFKLIGHRSTDNEPLNFKALQIYPNPMNDFVFLDNFSDENLLLKMYSSIGELLKTIDIPSRTKHAIDLTTVSEHLLFLTYKSNIDHKFRTFKLIKN